MSKYWITIFCFSFLFLFLKKTDGQTYDFSNYTVESGLSQSQILSVFQDDDGVMWFGTNGGGITKYDGNSYEYITDKDGLADNVVFSIVKDKKGRILIGTNNGLSVFDGKYFKNYTTQNGLNHNRIYTIFFDTNGNTLLGTGKGVSVFQDFVCSSFKIGGIIDSALVFNISEDSKRNLWFSTLGNGAFKYDGHVLKNYTAKDGFKTDYVYSVMEYESNKYWFLIETGLYELNDKGVKQINPANIAGETNYYSYLKDINNNIWISCSAGVLKYDGKHFQLFTQKSGLVNNAIWKIFQDREKNIWFASKENGLSKLASERFLMYTIKDGLIFNKINKIFQSKDGRYWIGSDKGLSIYDGKKFINYSHNLKSWEDNDEIRAIIEDKEGDILIGTDYGVLKYNGRNFEKIECRNNNNLNFCHDILIDTKDEIWLGTNAGVAKIIKGSITEFNKPGIPKKIVFKIYEDDMGAYWFATEDGLYKWDGSKIKHFTEKDGFTQKRVVNIVHDKNNNLWFATSSGVFKYSKGKFTSITEKDGLSSNIVQSIAIGKNDIIWAGLPDGVDKIEINENGNYSIVHFGMEDGFLGEGCILNSILIDKDEKIWFGAEKGLMVYQAQYDRKNTLEPITRIKGINLFGQKTDWKLFTDSLDRNQLPANLELAYDRNYLTFNFIGVSLTAPTKVSYRYKLKGLDTDWLPETQKNEAIYSNIPPGDYEFLVMANNGEGVWNKEPISFKFTVLPPFWRTWWFYSLIGLILLSGIYSYVKIKAANVKIVKQSHIIEEKNAALNDANWEIAGKNKSITDSINYAQRIQQSFLTSESLLKTSLKDYFILYKPRDIVSGDFYWSFDLPDRTLIACADSTGHGIPGAFMSLIGISLLNEISHSKKMIDPNHILDELRRIIICALNPEQVDSGGKDGMDISLLSIFKSDTDEVRIHFSGANNATFLVSAHKDVKDLIEFKGDKQPVGYYSNMVPFSQKEISVRKGDMIYMFTDGFADQFGGYKGKKYMSKQLKRKLLSIWDLPLKEQEKILDEAFLEWKGNLEQVDDVTVVGIRI
ncbi:MAG: two-component regulator propeller domain-containing protein [Bacteroidota bacterium]